MKNEKTIKTIRLEQDTYSDLEKFKQQLNYKSYNILIKKMVHYFIQNAVSPETKINLNLQKTIQKFNDDYIKRDESFRKWVGMIYHKEIFMLIDDQKKLLKEIKSINEFVKENEGQKIVAEFAKKWIETNQNKNTIEKNNQSYFESQDELNKLIEGNKRRDKIINDKEEIINNMRDKIKLIIEDAEVETIDNKKVYNFKLSEMIVEILLKL